MGLKLQCISLSATVEDSVQIFRADGGAGVLESVLGRALDAFRHRITAAVGTSAAGELAASPSFARLMAAEPSAPLAGDAVAFFAGHSDDSVNTFVTEVLTAGAALAYFPLPH